MRSRKRFLGVTSVAVLYFCFAFSFFVNFWFYLPIIFQLAFFWLFDAVLFVLPTKISRPAEATSLR